jgi:hypothetical protein
MWAVLAPLLIYCELLCMLSASLVTLPHLSAVQWWQEIQLFSGGKKSSCSVVARNPAVQWWQEIQTAVQLLRIGRVGQNRIYAPYMAVYLVISLPKIPYIHRIYMVLAKPTH